MKKTLLLLILCCAAIACKKTEVNFSFAPEAPRAGEKVQFTNLSSSGEDWEWAFGDGSTSTLKSPSHIYKRPGTYLVSLKVDKKNSLRLSKELTVYDTIPTFVCEDSVFHIYEDYSFTANVYNPYNYDIQYQWYWPTDAYIMPYFEVIDDDWNAGTLKLYFTRPMQEAVIGLRLIVNKDTTIIERSFVVQDTATNSLLIRTPEADYRQRIFGDRAEEAYEDESASDLLDEEQDTVQTYNGKEFTLAELGTVFAGIKGFHIASRKIYYRADGLWVANIDGAYQVQIDAEECYAMTLDPRDSRIYWANKDGVWYMPFVGSDNNNFITTPQQLNDLYPITKLAADATNH